MTKEVFRDAEDRMKKAVLALKKELSTLRTGRATPALLDKITVDYYGAPTPINQLANISVPEPRLLVVQPRDKQVIGEIERALLKSDLGLTPNSDGSIIRLPIPQLMMNEEKSWLKSAEKRKTVELPFVIFAAMPMIN